MPTRLTDYERHLLRLISQDLLGVVGNGRHPTLLAMRERGLVGWGKHGMWLTDKGREAMEGGVR